jgi:hypothetical protein
MTAIAGLVLRLDVVNADLAESSSFHVS